MADSEPSASTARASRSWTVGAVALALFVVVVALVIVAIPRGGRRYARRSQSCRQPVATKMRKLPST